MHAHIHTGAAKRRGIPIKENVTKEEEEEWEENSINCNERRGEKLNKGEKEHKRREKETEGERAWERKVKREGQSSEREAGREL